MAEGGHAREFRGGRCCARSLSLARSLPIILGASMCVWIRESEREEDYCDDRVSEED